MDLGVSRVAARKNDPYARYCTRQVIYIDRSDWPPEPSSAILIEEVGLRSRFVRIVVAEDIRPRRFRTQDQLRRREHWDRAMDEFRNVSLTTNRN